MRTLHHSFSTFCRLRDVGQTLVEYANQAMSAPTTYTLPRGLLTRCRELHALLGPEFSKLAPRKEGVA